MDKLSGAILFIIVLTSRTKVLSFNIEDRDPMVKRANPDQKDSYFGFSVAQHAVSENSRSQGDYWILVGAPLGNNLQPGTNQSGALFKCPVSKDQQDCVQVETDGKRLHMFEYDDEVSQREPQYLLPPDNDEIKNNQWLGVTVKSQKPGGKVVVCAHRYIQSSNLKVRQYGMGLCYLLSEKLETEEDLQPCKGRPTEKLHQQFGYCQVGTSLALLDDGFTLMGSPGPYTWRGTIFAEHVVGDFLDKDKTVYKGPLNDNPTPIDKYSYLGMSVTGGYFFDKTLIYVSGAPRSQFTGQVFFFRKVKSQEELDIILIITGKQFASSFGYEILATDVNSDGYDDLLVGAPFFYGNEKGGAVYVYDDIRNCNNHSCNYTTLLTGEPESRFGFAMASLGDINRDGYTDVAIGAPYESGGGAIYIYLGSKNGLTRKPSQKIQHESSGIRTLGYSLSGGLDMDLNEYPDLLAGAYESDMVILYKTRPIIDIAITIKGREYRNINATKKGCAVDPTNVNKTCFSFESCFTISKFRLMQPLEVRYDIKELPKKVPRVTFKDTKTTKYITVSEVEQENCQLETAYLVEGNGDILSPIKFVVNYSLHDNKQDSPILNKTSVKEFEATFQKNCGEDDICKSNLILYAGTMLEETEDGYVLDLAKNKELLVDANVTNLGEPAYEAKLFIVHPEALSYIALQSTENNTNNIICTSVNDTTMVSCSLGNPFQANKTVNLRMRFEIKDTKQQKLDLKVFVNSTSLELSKQTSQSFTTILQKVAYYVIKGTLQTPNVFYSGNVKGQSAMRYLEDIGPKVYHTYEVINLGQWNIRDMKVVIQWPYQVYSERPEGGKWLLYLEKQPLIDWNDTNHCFVDPPVVNPLNLTYLGIDEDVPKNVNEVPSDTTGKTRRKRDVEEVVAPEIKTAQDGKQRKVVTMDCSRKSAKCAKITCTIPELNENTHVTIQIFSRIWNSTLVEDYNKVDWVSIKSVGEVFFPDATILHSNDSVRITTVETQAYPGVVLADSSLNIWIIIGSVLAGLFLLIILVLILYKLGFFKRNRIKDHTLSGNLKKQDENETLLKDSEGKPAKSAL